MKICKTIWSTNRLEYLIPTLQTSDEFIDWGDHEVDGIFIDDMPTDRNDDTIRSLAESYGYNYIRLHKENKGLANTWEETIDILSNLEKDYDFIWHQEDDLIINDHVKIDDIIKYLNENDWCLQVSLAYQTDWYSCNLDRKIADLPLDKWNDFYSISSNHFNDYTFDASFSLIKASHYLNAIKMWKEDTIPELVNLADHSDYIKERVFCEGAMWGVINAYNNTINDTPEKKHWAVSLYSKDKKNLIEHVGEWSWGQLLPDWIINNKIKGVEENPDSWSEGYKYQISKMKEMMDDPSKKRSSRTWERLD